MKKIEKTICIVYTDSDGRNVCLEGTILRKNRKSFLVKVFKKIITFKDKVVSISFSPQIENIKTDFRNIYCRDRAPYNLMVEAWDDEEY